jgi:hypothetical protein
MTSFLQIKNIFYSGGHSFRGDSDPINEITFLVDEGFIQIQQVSIASKDVYLELFQDSSLLHQRDEAAGGSLEHVCLKICASNYLKSRGVICEFEHPFCGYYPDVVSTDRSVVIECGHTQNAEKMLTYFQQGNINEFIQVPYPDVSDDNIIGYQFLSINPDLKGFLDYLEQEKRQDIKQIFKSRGKE